MKNTRFMDRLFSAVEENDEELAKQVAKDIEDAKANGSVDTEEVKYENMGDGKVSVTDKENGEVTIVEKASDESDTYDMYPANQSEQIEGYLHPESDGVTPGAQVGAADEKVEDHMDGRSVIAPNMGCGGLNPEAGHEKSVEVTAQEGPQPKCEECEENMDEKEFSVSTDNSVVLRIFSDQEYCERLFSEVIESEETAKVGNLKVEKIPEEEEANSIVVTDEKTGDRAKVTLDGEEMTVTELDSKNFSDAEQYTPMFVVGVSPTEKIIVDAPVYTEESAQELMQSLAEKGIEGVQVFEDPNEAREYAISLLEGLGVQHEEDIEEPVQAEFSDHTIYLTEFNAPEHSEFMCRLFSESINGIGDIQSAVEDAIGNGDEIETDNEIITPIDSKTAVVEDKGSDEFTKISLEGPEMELEKISEDQAQELTDHIAVSEDEEDEEEEKEFSEIEKYFSEMEDVYCDETETKFFSDTEEVTEYMVRLYSDESDSAEIEKAIAEGEQIENDSEVITPIDSKTAIVEDKDNGEFTKATLDDDNVELHPISEEEADNLTEDLAVEDKDDDEDEEDDEEEEKEFSIVERYFSETDGNIYCDETETKFFSDTEEITSYMERLYSDECDCKDVEDAIENGEQIETDSEIITPIDSKSAVVEDKDNGEFTKATITEDEDIEVHPLTEEEADSLTDGLAIEEAEKKFSDDPILDKFFADIAGAAEQPVGATPVPAGSIDPNTPVIPLADPNAAVPADMAAAPVDGSMGAPTVEAIEDKALAAVQSIRAVADEAANQIMEAKAAPAPGTGEDLREAQFSEKMNDQDDTLVSWLNGTKRK